ncbi:MAG TPA: hypothetical protein VLL52_13390 [Anaerolineae bacterium]|nr:hypothetical protein [Anaerolineae bacterium]
MKNLDTDWTDWTDFFCCVAGGEVMAGVRFGDFDADFGDWTDFLGLVG